TVILVGNKETVGNQLHDTDEELDGQELEANYMYMAKIQEVLLVTADATGPIFDSNPLENVQIDDEYNVFANEHEHTKQPKNMNDTTLMEKVDSNTILDSLDLCNNDFQDDQHADDNEDERQLKKANATLTHELDEYKSALEESNDIKDRCRSALHQREIELEKYKVFKNYQLEKEEVKLKYKETLHLLAQRKHQSDEALKTQAYETFQ
ncbi:hypothetical protein Tco_0082176, partial [Tanacetum coccineum]